MIDLSKKQWTLVKKNQQIHKKLGMYTVAVDPMNVRVTLTGYQVDWLAEQKITSRKVIKAMFSYVEEVEDDDLSDGGMFLDLMDELGEPYTINVGGYIGSVCGQGYGAWMDGVVEGLSGYVGCMTPYDWGILEVICENFLEAMVPSMRWVG